MLTRTGFYHISSPWWDFSTQLEFGSGHVAVDVYRIETEHVKASCLYN